MASASEQAFGRIYRGIRADLAQAARVPGAQIRVDETAKLYGSSPTPVREALWRLAGERLVVESRRRGFFVPLPSADDLRQLYVGVELQLLAAVRAAPDHAGMTVRTAGRFYPLLFAILQRSRQPLLIDCGQIWVERLAAAMAIEDRILDTAGECDALADLLRAGEPRALARGIRGYCRRRAARSADLARAVRALAAPGAEYIPDML